MKKILIFILLCVSIVANAQTISEKLIEVNDAKQNIRSAIASKSIDMTGVPFTDYHLSIASITSGGGDAEGTALAADVLTGKTFSNDTNIGIAGTMPDNGAVNITPGAATQTIPLGYHNGSGIVEAISAENLYEYNIASGVEILGVTGTLEPIASISYSMVTQVELATAGIRGDLFYAQQYIATMTSITKTANPDSLPSSAVWGCSMNASGSILVSGMVSSPYLTLYGWDGVKYAPINSAFDIMPTGGVYRSKITPDGNYIAVSTTSSPYLLVYKWDSGTSQYKKQDTDASSINNYSATISDDGVFVITAHSSSPYIRSYKWSVGLEKYVATNGPNQVSAVNHRACAASGDGQKLIVALAASPVMRSYTWSEANFRYEADSAIDTIPAGQGYGVAISENGLYAVVTTDASPFITTYIFNSLNNRYEKTATPPSTSSGEGAMPALSPDGEILICPLFSSPYLAIFRKNKYHVYEQISNPDVMPSSAAKIAAVSADGSFVAVGQTASPYLLTYTASTSTQIGTANPAGGLFMLPQTATLLGVLLQSGSASDTVDLGTIWRKY